MRDYTGEAVNVAAGMPVAPLYFQSTQSYAPGVRVGGHAESYKATTKAGKKTSGEGSGKGKNRAATTPRRE